MKLGKVGKIMAIGSSTVAVVSAIVAVIVWLSANVVWAGDYVEDRRQQTIINLESQIDRTKDDMRETSDPVYKKDLEDRLERYKARLLELEKMKDKE